jgi:predicted ATPase
MSLDFSNVGLVGRQSHLQTLQEALQSSETTAIFMEGASGVGKTALVRHFLKHGSSSSATESFVLHGTGKFDQYALAAVPFNPILQALGRLIDNLMKLPNKPRQRIQGQIHRSLNSSQRKTLQRLVPKSRQLWAMLPSLKGRRRNLMASITPDSAVESEGDERQSLSHSPAQTVLTLQSLVRALAAYADTRIVIVLEDLHWASPESIDLVRKMFVSRDTSASCQVKLLATYRSVTPSVTALRQAVERSSSNQSHVCHIPVTDLEFASTHQLLMQTLNVSTPADTVELAEVIHQKTLGNPDFVLRFLEHLSHTNMLEYSMTKFLWVWDIRTIQSATNVTDNVVQVLTQQIHRLSPEAEEVLSLAGCLGFYFGIAEIKEIVLREDVLSGPSRSILPCSDKGRATPNLSVVLESPSLSGRLPRAAFSERVMTASESSAMSKDLLARSKSLSRRNMMTYMARSGAQRRSRYHPLTACKETVKSTGAKTLWLATLLGEIEKEGLIERASDSQYKVRSW